MNTKKLIATFSAVVLLAGSALPVLADSTITISGNGSDTTNTTNLSVTQTTQVQQSNSSNITNNVSSSSNSGGNQASYNTGGNVDVNTGSATTNTTVTNTANSNVANTGNCNCGTGNLTDKISGNGTGSANTTNTSLTNQVEVGQTNEANISNDVNAKSNSGKNDANYNTGGDVSVSTGNATTKVDLMTNANSNVAQVGGSGGAGSTTSILINGNGADTTNKANLDLTDWVVLGQSNSADVLNLVTAKSNTGENKADFNTGGQRLGDSVSIDTGNAKTDVTADTAVNFNQASVGCDCLTDVTAKIDGNGASDLWHQTTDVINASLTNGQEIGQANGGEGIMNGVNGKSSTGDNKTNSNTGTSVDPSVMTGDSTSNTDVNNQGNVNIFGGNVTNPFTFPWMGGNTNVTVTFSLQDLLSALGL